eukprot:scaffold627537_cov18-Prasinocladus_malaysianus.AAC.1
MHKFLLATTYCREQAACSRGRHPPPQLANTSTDDTVSSDKSATKVTPWCTGAVIHYGTL